MGRGPSALMPGRLVRTRPPRRTVALQIVLVSLLVTLTPGEAWAVPPANDDLGGATVISALPFADALNTTEATTAGDDPTTCFFNNNSVWYAFTPDQDMPIFANTFGSNYDTLLSAYTESGGVLTQVACNDDYGGVQSYIEFAATAGTTYYFMVASYGAGGGDLEFGVDRVRTPSTLRLTASRRRVTYNQTVTLTAHLDEFAGATNRVVDIYKTPYNGTKTLVISGEIDEFGDLSTPPVTMKKKTTFVGEWAGDENYLADASDPKVVAVRVITKTKLSGHYATSGAYKLYHAGDDPKQTGTVVPNHAGKRLGFQAQVRVGESWVTIATANPRIRSNGSVSLRLIDPPSGYNFRVRNRFSGDRDHLGDTSSWKYFRVTS